LLIEHDKYFHQVTKEHLGKTIYGCKITWHKEANLKVNHKFAFVPHAQLYGVIEGFAYYNTPEAAENAVITKTMIEWGCKTTRNHPDKSNWKDPDWAVQCLPDGSIHKYCLLHEACGRNKDHVFGLLEFVGNRRVFRIPTNTTNTIIDWTNNKKLF